MVIRSLNSKTVKPIRRSEGELMRRKDKAPQLDAKNSSFLRTRTNNSEQALLSDYPVITRAANAPSLPVRGTNGSLL
jgi:hypothetical protein